MMISVGYYFDQVSLERMTERLSSQVELITRSRPTDTPVHNTEAIWIETAHPVYHQLDVKWSIDGKEINHPAVRNNPYLNIGAMDLPAGVKTVSVPSSIPHHSFGIRRFGRKH